MSEPNAGFQPVIFEDDPNRDNLIHLVNVHQTYNDGKVVQFDGLNLIIEKAEGRGRLISVMGPSGCGKSTILKYITGLQKPTSGQVLIHGHERTPADVVGMVFQQYSSYDWLTVLENVMLPLKLRGVPRKEAEERAMELIQLLELEPHKDKYARLATGGLSGLSGGQLQRVAIARCLVVNPEIFVMDEPFGALDAKTRLRSQLLLLKIWDKIKSTVIFVTHDPGEAVLLGDELWIMRASPGQIVVRTSIDLPTERGLDTKHSVLFRQQADKVEDIIMSL